MILGYKQGYFTGNLPVIFAKGMNTAFLLIGSNEGDRLAWFHMAMQQIAATCGTIDKTSGIYQTAAWGVNDQPDFLNAVISIQTLLSPTALLHTIQLIEKEAGRQREIKWGQRTLDIDILMYNEEIIDTPELKIPHPSLHTRLFTLIPFDEIAPQLVHPVLHKTTHRLLMECTDTLAVKKYEQGL